MLPAVFMWENNSMSVKWRNLSWAYKKKYQQKKLSPIRDLNTIVFIQPEGRIYSVNM